MLFQREQDLIWCFFKGNLDEKQIWSGLKEKLARYMIPDRFVRLEEMPHTPSMKVDRVTLWQMMK